MTIHGREQNYGGGGVTSQNQKWGLEKPVFFVKHRVFWLKTGFFEKIFAIMLKNVKKFYFMRKIPKNTRFSENSTPHQSLPLNFFRTA